MQPHDDKIDVSLLRFRHRPFWCCARVRVLVYVYVCICVSSCWRANVVELALLHDVLVLCADGGVRAYVHVHTDTNY